MAGVAKKPTDRRKRARRAGDLENRQLQRAAQRYFREHLEHFVLAHWGIFARAERLDFSSRVTANELYDFLLEMDAIDFGGIAALIHSGDSKTIALERRRRLRATPG